MTTQQATSTSNQQYDLASVLYHALKGAQTCATYIQDAERTGDTELAQFFRQAQQMQNQCAEQAKALLTRRVTQGSGTVH